MDTTTIEVTSGTWTALNQKKQPGESFDDVIQRKVINSDDTPSEEEIRNMAQTYEASTQNGPVPREQIGARFEQYDVRAETEEEALDKLVETVQGLKA